jgi:hypothetical protein
MATFQSRMQSFTGTSFTRKDGKKIPNRIKLVKHISRIVSLVNENQPSDKRTLMAIANRYAETIGDTEFVPIVARACKLAERIWFRPGGEHVPFSVIREDVLDLLDASIQHELECRSGSVKPCYHSFYSGMKRRYQELRHEAQDYSSETATESNSLDVRELCHKVAKDVSQQCADMLFDKWCGSTLAEIGWKHECSKQYVQQQIKRSVPTVERYLR